MNGFLPSAAQGFARNAGEAKYPALWRGYLGGIVPWLVGRKCPNPAPNRYDPTQNGTAWDVVGAPLGRAMKFTGNASVQWASGAVNPFKVGQGEGPITIQAHFKYVHKTSATKMWLFRSDAPTVGQPHYGYGLYVEANQDQLVFTIDQGNGAAPQPAKEWKAASSSLVAGKWHHVVATFYAWDIGDIGQYVMMWIDGVPTYPGVPAVEGNFIHRSADHSRCGAVLGWTNPDFEIDLLSVWNARLAWREIDLLSADPVAMFRRSTGGGIGKAARRVSLGGATLRRLNPVLAG